MDNLKTLTYALEGNFGALALSHTPDARYRSATVDVETLDARWRGGDGFACPALVKIDVEGYEAHVLNGGAAMIAACRPAIIIENNCRNAR